MYAAWGPQALASYPIIGNTKQYCMLNMLYLNTNTAAHPWQLCFPKQNSSSVLYFIMAQNQTISL
jgi:hypothetical protein